MGAAFVLKAIATLLLWCIWRPQIRRYSLREFGLLALLGGAIACMSVAFYGAIERIPMGVASTLEFTGPLGVAVFDSRRSLDLVWVGMAAMGVMLLSPTTGIIFDPIGIGFALLSAGCWAAYILLSRRAGRVFPGGQGLTLAMSAAALFLLPFGVAQAGTALLSPAVLWVGVGVAILGTLVPYSLEYAALKRVPPRIFGILMSVEPAIAALVGFLFLHEALSLRSLLAVVLVTSAAIGVTVFGRGSQRH